jgi:hypothetical protein
LPKNSNLLRREVCWQKSPGFWLSDRVMAPQDTGHANGREKGGQRVDMIFRYYVSMRYLDTTVTTKRLTILDAPSPSLSDTASVNSVDSPLSTKYNNFLLEIEHEEPDIV